MRVHGTTGEAPIDRFRRIEAQALKPIAGMPPFQAARELIRRVQSDCAVEIDGNAYSVPWRLIGEMVRATIMDGTVRIHHGLHEVAVQPKPRSATTPYWKSQPWRRDLNQTASGKPGAVQNDYGRSRRWIAAGPQTQPRNPAKPSKPAKRVIFLGAAREK